MFCISCKNKKATLQDKKISNLIFCNDAKCKKIHSKFKTSFINGYPYTSWNEWFSQFTTNTSYKQTMFSDAVENNNITRVKKLLRDNDVDPAHENSESLYYAIDWGYTEIVRLLLKDGRANPNDYDSDLPSDFPGQNFVLACKHGYTNIVWMLLLDNRIDPSVKDNRAISVAIKNGHRTIIQLILLNKQVTVDDNAIIIAMQYKQPEILMDMLMGKLDLKNIQFLKMLASQYNYDNEIFSLL